MADFTIQKTDNAEVYELRFGLEWATVVIKSGEKSGHLLIASSFGTWSNWWPSTGEGFKRFLTGLDIHYTAGKFGCGRWFDHEDTMKELRRMVDEHDNEEERELMMEELETLDDCTEVNQFCLLAYQSETLPKLWDTGPDIRYDVDPQFRQFWKVMWQPFMNELKQKEIGA